MIWGDHISIGENSHISEEDTKIDAHIGHLKIGKNTRILDGVKIWTHNHKWSPFSENEIPTNLDIGDNVIVGAYSLILPQCQKIGDNAIIGAGAVVTKDVPPNEVWGGNPAEFIKYNMTAGPMFREIYPKELSN